MQCLVFRDARLRIEDERNLPTPPQFFKAIFAEKRIRQPSGLWCKLICTGCDAPPEPNWLDDEVRISPPFTSSLSHFSFAVETLHSSVYPFWLP